MTALGLGLFWGGYLIFCYGYTTLRGYQMTLSDLALPTHRPAALASITAGAQNLNAAATSASSSASSSTPPPVSQLPAQGGTYKQPGTGIPIKVGPAGPGGTRTVTPG